MNQCQTALETANKNDPELAYREGLCLEALGRWKEADAAYQRSDDPNGDVGEWARATLGRARCAAHERDLFAATKLVGQVLLRSGHPNCWGGRIREECLHLRARLAVLALDPPRVPEPFDPDALAWASFGTRLDKYLDWLPPGQLPASPSHPADDTPDVAWVSEDIHGQPVFTAHLVEKPIMLLESIGAAADLRVRVESTIAPALAGEAITVDVLLTPLAEVLDALTRPFRAEWRIDGDVLIVEPAHPTRSTERELAVDAIPRALDGAPDHPDARVLRVGLANLDYQAGRWREAGAAYRQLLERAPHTSESTHAAYNLGLSELRQGNLPAARGRFLDAIDRGPTTHWADLGWWWVGRTHLDAGETVEARRAFESARRGRAKPVTSASALGICICEILEGDDAAARTILRERRVGVGETEVALRELFEASLRYRVSPSESRRDILVQALRAGDEARALGPAGVFLAGVAYRDIGLHDRMVALYEKATESIRGPLATRMTFAVAERFNELDLRAEARQRYLVVAATDPRGLGPQAELRVAELAARDGRADECVRRCRDLVDRPGVDRVALLTTLGHGYELQRRYRLAAECFAGRLPSE